MDRKKLYFKWVLETIPSLTSFQNRETDSENKGCFFYPYWRGEANYINARWQEAVLTLSWFYNKNKDKYLKTFIEDGIDFWCRIQNRNGSFPEYQKNEASFATTSFTTIAILRAMEIIGLKEKWLKTLEKCGGYLCRNNEFFFTNQQAAASLALLLLYDLTKEEKYLVNAEKKMDSVLTNQTPDGFFKENHKRDLSYSSLTLSLIGEYYLRRPSEKILNASKRYIRLVPPFIFPDGSFGGMYNSRTTGWLILNGFEIFAKKEPGARYIINQMLKCHLNRVGDVRHLPDDRHLCTDSYNLCFAYENASANINDSNTGTNTESVGNLKFIKKRKYLAITSDSNSALYSLWANNMRIISDLHKSEDVLFTPLFRKFNLPTLRRIWRSVPKKEGKIFSSYVFLEDRIDVKTKRPALLLAFHKEPKIIFESSTDLKVRGFSISSNQGMTHELLGRVPIGDSLFYNKASLCFLKMGFCKSKNQNVFKYSLIFP